jgi:hypothetical protein
MIPKDVFNKVVNPKVLEKCIFVLPKMTLKKLVKKVAYLDSWTNRHKVRCISAIPYLSYTGR